MDPTRNTTLEGGTPDRVRIPAIDALRGAAVVAMASFHTAWDLSALDLIETDIGATPAWQWYARAIAATFLTLVGVGLALAHRDGVRLRAFGLRLLAVAGAAALVTIGTLLAFPDSFIFFGVLHNIALSSVLALPFARAPALASALVAIAIVAAAGLLAGPAFDAPWLSPLGLGLRVPVTNDFVPVFPWTGFVFAGVAIGRLLLCLPPAVRAPAGARPGPIGRVLGAIGRRSLAIYLLHQPLIFGALWAVAQVMGPNPAAEAAPFLRSCQAGCDAGGTATPACRTACQCTVDGLRSDGLWAAVGRGRPTPEQFERAQAIGRACLGRSG